MKLTPENPPHPDPEFVELVQRVLDHEASLEDVARLNAVLPRDPAALRYFVKMRMLHVALEDEFGATSIELDSIQGRLTAFPVGDRSESASWSGTPAVRTARRWAAAAAVALLASLAAYWGGKRVLTRPAFEIVARYSTGSSSVPASGTWLNRGERLTIGQGVVELRSADGNSVTLEGPGNLTIHDPHTLTLDSGKLWAVIEGDPVRIRTPQAEITDLGTTFGIDLASKVATRIDVFDGSVRLTNPSDPSLHADADVGESLVSHASQWPPKMANADAARYTTGLRTPLGLAFVRNPAETSRINSALPFGTRWTFSSTPSGKVRPKGGTFEIAWTGSSFFSTGADRSAVAALFHTHLTGYPWEGKYAERSVEAARIGLPAGDYGVIIQLRGMSAWLAQIGAGSYRVTLLRNSGVPQIEFLPVTAHAGAPSAGPALELLKIWQEDYHAADYPDGSGGTGARAIGSFKKPFTADILTLTLPVQETATWRANVSGLIVTPLY